MQNQCSFKSVIVYGGVAYISSDKFTVSEKFATQPIADCPLTLSKNFTRQIPLSRFARYIQTLIDLQTPEELQEYFGASMPVRQYMYLVNLFLESEGFVCDVHEFQTELFQMPNIYVYVK